jgi:F-type H+-transporting ATPase subunit b
MTFNVWTFILETINFVVLAWVLHRLLYRPLHDAIDRRREALKRTQAEAQSAREEADAIKHRLEEQLANVEQQRRETMLQAREQADHERSRAIQEAQEEARRLGDEAHQSIERDREEMIQRLHREVVGRALDLAERLLRQAADSTLQAQLARHLIESLDTLPEDLREQLRRDSKAEETARLETAAKPDVETLRRLVEAISRLVGREVKLDIRDNSALISGVRLHIDGHVWDASIAGQLEEVRSAP